MGITCMTNSSCFPLGLKSLHVSFLTCYQLSIVLSLYPSNNSLILTLSVSPLCFFLFDLLSSALSRSLLSISLFCLSVFLSPSLFLYLSRSIPCSLPLLSFFLSLSLSLSIPLSFYTPLSPSFVFLYFSLFHFTLPNPLQPQKRTDSAYVQLQTPFKRSNVEKTFSYYSKISYFYIQLFSSKCIYIPLYSAIF